MHLPTGISPGPNEGRPPHRGGVQQTCPQPSTSGSSASSPADPTTNRSRQPRRSPQAGQRSHRRSGVNPRSGCAASMPTTVDSARTHAALTPGLAGHNSHAGFIMHANSIRPHSVLPAGSNRVPASSDSQRLRRGTWTESPPHPTGAGHDSKCKRRQTKRGRRPTRPLRVSPTSSRERGRSAPESDRVRRYLDCTTPSRVSLSVRSCPSRVLSHSTRAHGETRSGDGFVCPRPHVACMMFARRALAATVLKANTTQSICPCMNPVSAQNGGRQRPRDAKGGTGTVNPNPISHLPFCKLKSPRKFRGG